MQRDHPVAEAAEQGTNVSEVASAALQLRAGVEQGQTGIDRAPGLAFLRLGGGLGQAHPAQLAESVAVNALLTWAHPVKPSAALAALIRAAYDPLLPACSRDPSHALRLAARLQASSS